MESDRDYWQKSIASLKKSRNYLQQKVELEPSYIHLIEKLDSRINSLKNNCQPVIKFVSFPQQIGLDLQAISESDLTLRSHYNFVTLPRVNFAQIFDCCNLIFLIYSAQRKISLQQRKLVNLAKRRKISLFVLVVPHNSCTSQGNLANWLEERKYKEIKSENILFDSFFDLACPHQVTRYKSFLLDKYLEIKQQHIQQVDAEIVAEIRSFFETTKINNWQEIKKIKQDSLQGRGIPYYQQQIINKTFNKINKQQQQKILFLKQKINQSRSNYLNPFLSNSWLFQLQQIIEKSEVKLVKEEDKTYLYYVIKSNNSLEYLHTYILGLYQQQVIDVLDAQWHNLNYLAAQGGFQGFINLAHRELAAINLFEESELESLTIDVPSKINPRLELKDFIDPYCLKINSRIVFDYNYFQSSWFKLLLSTIIGTAIYFATELYFGTGKYIGFFILIFQIINISTGQTIKNIKLKQHQKELYRTINNKYQTLIRLMVEQLINTLITNLDRQNQQYQQEFDAIAQLAQTKLDKIEEQIEQLKSRKNRLETDLAKLIAWFN